MKSRTRALVRRRRKPDHYKHRLFRYWHIDHLVEYRGQRVRFRCDMQVLLTPEAREADRIASAALRKAREGRKQVPL